MVAMADSMHRRSAQTVVSLATNVLGSRTTGEQRSIDGNHDRAEVVHLIVNDCLVRERIINDLALNGVIVRTFASADEYSLCPLLDATACIIAELRQGDVSNSEMQEQLVKRGGPPVIFIGTELEMTSGIRAIKAGALDFLIHPVRPEVLRCSVEEAFLHRRISLRRQGENAALKACYSSLTPREREVFALVAQGLLNKQVAGLLAISLVTVQIHRSNTMRKMAARSFADLVYMALRLQILEKDRDAQDSPRRMRYQYALAQENGISA